MPRAGLGHSAAMTSTRLSLLALLCTCALIGCGSSTSGGAGGGSGGVGGGAGGACNSLANNAPTVSKMTNAGPPPAMTGGTLMDGTWFLTGMDRYNGSTGSSSHKETWVFTGNKVEIVTFKSTDSVEKHYSATYTISGTTVVLTVNCPMSLTLNNPFTATATKLQVINSDDAEEMHTFTRQ
jgi:hypothetical protein